MESKELPTDPFEFFDWLEALYFTSPNNKTIMDVFSNNKDKIMKRLIDFNVVAQPIPLVHTGLVENIVRFIDGYDQRPDMPEFANIAVYLVSQKLIYDFKLFIQACLQGQKFDEQAELNIAECLESIAKGKQLTRQILQVAVEELSKIVAPYKTTVENYELPVQIKNQDKIDLFAIQGPRFTEALVNCYEGNKINELIEVGFALFPKFKEDMGALFENFKCDHFKVGSKTKKDERGANDHISENRIYFKYLEGLPGGKEIIDSLDMNNDSDLFNKVRDKVGQNQFYVYDLLRCGAKFFTIEDLNSALIQFSKKYEITRIKNKLDTPLSQLLVNFKYSGPFEYYDNEIAHLILEAQFVYYPQVYGKDAQIKYALCHRVYEIERGLEDLNGLHSKMYMWANYGFQVHL